MPFCSNCGKEVGVFPVPFFECGRELTVTVSSQPLQTQTYTPETTAGAEDWLTSVEDVEAVVQGGGKAAENQIKRIHGLAAEKKYIDAKGRMKPQYRRLAKKMTGKTSAKDMTAAEANRLIEALEILPSPTENPETAEKPSDTHSDRTRKVRIALLTLIGCFVQLLSFDGLADLGVIPLLLFVIGSSLLFVGSYYWAKLKNLSWTYSFLGLMNFVGLLIIGLYHSKRCYNKAGSGTNIDRTAICGALLAIGLTVLVIGLAAMTGNLEEPDLFAVFGGAYDGLSIRQEWFVSWVLRPLLIFCLVTAAITTSLVIWKRIGPKVGERNKGSL